MTGRILIASSMRVWRRSPMPWNLCLLMYWLLVFAVTAVAQTPSTRPAQRPAGEAPRPQTAVGMTNADVVKMVKAGLSESLIIASIKQAEKRAFSLNVDDMVELKAAGVSDNIILVMLDPTAVITQPAA